MSVETVIIDRGERAFRKSLDEVDGLFVDIGIFGGHKAEGSGTTSIAEYALYNEMGTKDDSGKKIIPARPFFRSTIDEEGDKYDEFLKDSLPKIAQGKNPRVILRQLGLRIRNDIKKKITSLKKPKLEDATIKAKRSSNPLVNIGTMRDAITHELGKKR